MFTVSNPIPPDAPVMTACFPESPVSKKSPPFYILSI
jgi:hypothetical protein